jgi:methylenetetrahydrofolate dehydrogenase (NADP+)/methenyltetrahydrofolate cyclohydrolase/formyltetrahydrofolate synthetase
MEKGSASVINGTALAADITQSLTKVIDSKETQSKRPPCVAVLLVGDRKDSATYVRMKRKKAEQIGIQFKLMQYPEDVSQPQLEHAIRSLNKDDVVDGIIVQLPLPAHIEDGTVTGLVRPEKDVDGFQPANVGNLVTVGCDTKRPYFVACTARGVIRMIKQTGKELRGALVVLVGTGMVGKPLALLLMREDATVVCCNKSTINIESLTRQADIVVAACGVPRLVKGTWVKPGAVVIDVGINSIIDPSRKSGRRLVGDVDYDEVSKKLGPEGWISPVPHGVGPMTVAMLMTAVVESWKRRIK